MRFGLTEDQEQIRLTARELLDKRSGFDVVRRHAETRTQDAGLRTELAELGWPAIAVAEEYGGAGLGVLEAAILVEEHGNALASTALFGTMAAAAVIAEAGSDAQKRKWLPGLAAGELAGAIGTPELIVDPDGADVCVVRSGAAVALVEPGEVELVETIDPTRTYGRLTSVPTGEALGGNGSAGWAGGEILAAAELVGVARRALDITLDYVKQRQQFDRVVGSFQAVSHRCVQMYLAAESARTATYYGAWAVDTSDERQPDAVALAKALACDSARDVTGAAIQLHGGIGFTWEADLHWLYKRAQLMSQLLGPSRRHQAELAHLSAARLSGSTPLSSPAGAVRR